MNATSIWHYDAMGNANPAYGTECRAMEADERTVELMVAVESAKPETDRERAIRCARAQLDVMQMQVALNDARGYATTCARFMQMVEALK